MLSKEVRLVTSAFFTVPEYQASLDALAEGAIEPRLLVTDTIALGRDAGGVRKPQAPHQPVQGADRALAQGRRRIACLQPSRTPRRPRPLSARSASAR